MIEREHASLLITAQCRVVSISRSSFYYAPVKERVEKPALASTPGRLCDAAAFCSHYLVPDGLLTADAVEKVGVEVVEVI